MTWRPARAWHMVARVLEAPGPAAPAPQVDEGIQAWFCAPIGAGLPPTHTAPPVAAAPVVPTTTWSRGPFLPHMAHASKSPGGSACRWKAVHCRLCEAARLSKSSASLARGLPHPLATAQPRMA